MEEARDPSMVQKETYHPISLISCSEGGIIPDITEGAVIKSVPKKTSRTKGQKNTKAPSDLFLPNGNGVESNGTPSQNFPNLFRLFVKNGEYVYARSNDIVLIESCDHLVKVYVAFSDNIKKTIRRNTLKDLLLQLPKEQFVRIGRFCAVNINRLSGGNYIEQTFEFDFRISVRINHFIAQNVFSSFGR